MVEDVVSLKDAAEILGVSVTRVRQLCMFGTLPAMKIANNWLVDRQAVLNRRDNPPKPGRPKKNS